ALARDVGADDRYHRDGAKPRQMFQPLIAAAPLVVEDHAFWQLLAESRVDPFIKKATAQLLDRANGVLMPNVGEAGFCFVDNLRSILDAHQMLKDLLPFIEVFGSGQLSHDPNRPIRWFRTFAVGRRQEWIECRDGRGRELLRGRFASAILIAIEI